MKKVGIDFSINSTLQNKLIISALAISTAIIILIAFWAVSKIKTELDKSYNDFAQLLVKTVAIQNYEIAKVKNPQVIENIKLRAESIIASADDISYITFKDKNANVIYSTYEQNPDRAMRADTNISAPLEDEKGKIIGTVELGLYSTTAKKVTLAAKNSILFVFSAIWLVFTLGNVWKRFLSSAIELLNEKF